VKTKNTSGILSTKIDPKLKDKFNQVCMKQGKMPRTVERELFEPLLRDYIEKHKEVLSD